jgi:hypothetical protein
MDEAGSWKKAQRGYVPRPASTSLALLLQRGPHIDLTNFTLTNFTPNLAPRADRLLVRGAPRRTPHSLLDCPPRRAQDCLDPEAATGGYVAVSLGGWFRKNQRAHDR